MFKEKGYDEFLAAQIKQGQAELQQGNLINREQVLQEIQQTIYQAEKH